MGTRANHLEQAKKLRARAQECRSLANLAGQASPQSYLKLAESYEALAWAEEQAGAQIKMTRP